MKDDITYNQIISLSNTTTECQVIKKSFVEDGELILILEGDSQRITITGKIIDCTGHKKRITELVLKAKEQGFGIPENSIKHYAKEEWNEYVLVRW